jgi:transcription elongation factor Elf1
MFPFIMFLLFIFAVIMVFVTASAKNKRPQKTIQNQVQSPVKCPKCGSTQITAVTKKWSPVTGFLTNKVDRVCLNCKHKF